MNELEPILEKVGRTLTDRFRIRVLCRGTRCCTDGRHIYLPALPDSIPDDLRRAIRGYLDHEVSHVAHGSDFKLGAAFRQRHGEDAFGLLNCLEDVRVEAAMRRRFPGSAVNLAHAYDYAVASTIRRVEAGQPVAPLQQLAFGIAAYAIRRPAPTFIEPEIRKLADGMAGEIAQAVDAPNTAIVAKLAESAWHRISHHFTSTVPPSQHSHKNDTQAPSDNGSGEQPDSSTGTGRNNAPRQTRQGHPRKHRRHQNDAADGKMESPSDKASSSSAATGAIGGKGMGGADAKNGTAESAVTGSAGGIMDGLAQDIARAVADHATVSQAYRPWSTEHDRVMIAEGKDDGAHAVRLAPLMRHVAGVRQKLLQTLLAETCNRWLPDQIEGRLNPRALHRIAAAGILRQGGGSNMGSSLADRVFRTRIKTERMKTAVMLLVDQSHSMNNHRIGMARNTALVLCEALDRLHIPVNVTGFSTDAAGVLLRKAAAETGQAANALEERFRFAPLVFEVFKGFHEPFRRVSGRFTDMRTRMMTPLGEAILYGGRALAARSEPRKVLLVLTDGRPTVGMGNDTATFLHAKQSIVRVERAGVDVALVGIAERSVHDLHHCAVVVNHLDDLSGTVMNELRKILSPRTPKQRPHPHRSVVSAQV